MTLEFTREEWRELLEELRLWDVRDESAGIHIALIIEKKLKERG